MSFHDDMIKNLNELLTRNYDSEKGYLEAADEVENPSLKQFMKTYAEQRYRFGHELKGLIQDLGGEPDKGSSIQGDLHRMWIDFKSIITSGDENVIKECLNGEEKALNDYEDTLKDNNVPDNISKVIYNHIAGIKEAMYQLRELKNSYEYADAD